MTRQAAGDGAETDWPLRLRVAFLSLVAIFIFTACDSSAESAQTPPATNSPVSSPGGVSTSEPTSTSVSPTSGPLISDLPGLPAAISNRIAFASDDGAVYVIRPDGSGLRRVSQGEQDITLAASGSRFLWPVWSPDARHLLLTALTADVSGGFETSLLRVSAAGGDVPELMYLDVPGSDGIGGIPHYASWSPDSNRIAVIANIGDGLATFLIDRERGFSGQSVSNGSPVYFDWSEASGHMIVHTAERLILHEFGSDGSRIGSSAIGTGSISYRAPDFSPVSDEFLYVDVLDGVRSVFLGSLNGDEPTALSEGAASVAMQWSPEGNLFAIARGERSGGYENLDLIDPSGAERSVLSGSSRLVRAFWWSPDGTKILLAFESSENPDYEVELAVFEIAEETLIEIGHFLPSDETSFMMEFFDLYTNDHRVWSPDSTSFTFSGNPLGELARQLPDGQSDSDTSVDPKIWVIDAAGNNPPLSIGTGDFATWSPR